MPGLIHRDIKPENILVHERALKDGFATEGVVKVTDFGLGKAAVKTNVGSIMISGEMSQEAAQIAGTIDYMSPEQRSGADIDHRSDLYACGVILYELLTGERPQGTDLPSDLNPQSPKYLDEVFRHSYARLDKRYTSADEFLKALAVSGPPPMPMPQGGRFMPQPAIPPVPPPMPYAGVAMQARHATPVMDAGRLACPKCRQPVEANDQFCMQCGGCSSCRKCAVAASVARIRMRRTSSACFAVIRFLPRRRRGYNRQAIWISDGFVRIFHHHFHCGRGDHGVNDFRRVGGFGRIPRIWSAARIGQPVSGVPGAAI